MSSASGRGEEYEMKRMNGRSRAKTEGTDDAEDGNDI